MSPLRHSLFGVLMLAAVTGTLACGGSYATAPDSPDRNVLTNAEAKWNAAAIHNYDFDLVFRRFGWADSVQVEVRNDTTTAVTSYRTGQPALVSTKSVGTTIPALFGTLDTSIVSGSKVNVTYDPQLGYPALASVNPTYPTPAGGTNWQVVSFSRVP